MNRKQAQILVCTSLGPFLTRLCRLSNVDLSLILQRFRPMTVERPKVLLPLVNAPMINYTLEWLVSSGVDEASTQHQICTDFRVPASQTCLKLQQQATLML